MIDLVPQKAEVVGHVRAQREATIRLLETLGPTDWEQIVTPGWRVREVAAHLISTDEGAVTGRMFAVGLNRDISDIERWNDTQVPRWADRPVPSLLHALEVWNRRMLRMVRALPPAATARAFPTPLGKVSLNYLGMLRVYGEWIHDEDIRRTFGLPSDAAPEMLEPVARQMFAVIPHQTLPLLDPALRGVIEMRYTDLDLPPFSIDLNGRRFGWELGPPDATIRGEAAAMVMVAARRDAWKDVEDAGALAIEGDRTLAEALLSVLRAV
jgi:uncharacterized protein (TIGR03083 family)